MIKISIRWPYGVRYIWDQSTILTSKICAILLINYVFLASGCLCEFSFVIVFSQMLSYEHFGVTMAF